MRQPNEYEIEIFVESDTPQITKIYTFAWSAEDAVFQVTYNICNRSTSWDESRKALVPTSRVYAVRPNMPK